MNNNTLIDIMLICKGWYNKELYSSKLSAMKAYYDKYYDYIDAVDFTKEFAFNLFLKPLVEEAIKKDPSLVYYILNKEGRYNTDDHKNFETEMYYRCLVLIKNIKNNTFDLKEYSDMFDKAKASNYEDATIGVI